MKVPQDYRIAFFTNTYLPFVSGVSRSVQLYHDHLSLLGDRVIVYAPEYDDSNVDSEDVRRIAAISNFNNTEFSLPIPIASKPAADFRTENFDLVHVHHPFLLGELGLRLARQDKLPLVFTYHTQYEQYTHYIPINEDTAVRTILKHTNEFCDMCDLVIAPTNDIRRQLRRRGVTCRIAVLPSGIEMRDYERAEPGALREQYGFSTNDRLVLYVGRLAREKNLNYLFDAVFKVLEKDPRTVFAIAGHGHYEDALKEKANASGICDERIRFLGTITGQQLVDLYSAADVFVFASRSETQGMVIVEAMAGSTPVVALDADAVGDVVEDGVNGRLLHANANAEEFADAVLLVLDDKRGERPLSIGARRTAKAFDMPKLAARLQRMYRGLKLLPLHRLKQETMSFGLIRSYFSTIWENLSLTFSQI